MKYIYHHLGLGDHIICNGLVRSLIDYNQEYKMFVKSHNLESVSFMYRDLNNLSFLVGDDLFAKNYLQKNNIHRDNLIIAGFNRHPMSKSFDESFYLQNNLDFNNRWDKFHVKRDLDSENRIFESMELENNNYIFIHDDLERNYIIDENIIDNKNSLRIIRPIKGLTNNIFDYCKIIANSYSAHFIDSSFRLLCDSLSLKTNKIFYHINMKNGIKRNINNFDDSTSRLNFTII
jgi:hypothetical protein